jgi:hypothetical protein
MSPDTGCGAIVVLVALSLAALHFAIRERHRRVQHWHMLLPGVFAVAASVMIVAFPRVSDLWEPQRLIIAMFALLVGVARGRFMRLASDRIYRLTVLRSTWCSTSWRAASRPTCWAAR